MRLSSTASAAAVALSLGLCGAASATTFNIGSLPIAPSVYTNTSSVGTGAFTDIYNFLFPASGASASGSAVSINIDPILSISNIQVSIFSSPANTLVFAGPVGASSVVANVALTPGANYYYQVTGTGAGTAGGTYSFLASAAPIPEPGSYALMVAGLAAIGLMVRRRSAG